MNMIKMYIALTRVWFRIEKFMSQPSKPDLRLKVS